MKIAKVLTITFLFLLIAILFAGAGHGTYIPAKLIFPFTMLSVSFTNEINLLGVFLPLIQILIYNRILMNKPKLKYLLIGIHLFAVALCFYFSNDSF